MLEAGAKSCWNKFTRFLDKFSEGSFVLCLVANAIWTLASLFIGKEHNTTAIYIFRVLLSIYYCFLAFLIY